MHCAERWLQPGTEYADMSKLALSADWYEALGVNSNGHDSLQEAGEGAHPEPFVQGCC